MVARLTGLTVHNIRAWEKRYAVVEPTRTDTQRRLYTREDIRRLTLLKTLVDSGQPIGTIADLTVHQLEERVLETTTNGIPPTDAPELPNSLAGKARVILVGDRIQALFASRAGLGDSDFEVVAKFESLAELNGQKPSADLLMVDCPALFSETIDQISALAAQLGVRRSFLVYGFAHQAALQSTSAKNRITAIPGPISLEELRLACVADIELARGQRQPITEPELAEENETGEEPEIPPVLFSASQLSQLTNITSVVDCECPQHLANLLLNLTAFEAYSARCESKNAKDAKLHKFLHVQTASARSTIEHALAKLLKAEDIQI